MDGHRRLEGDGLAVPQFAGDVLVRRAGAADQFTILHMAASAASAGGVDLPKTPRARAALGGAEKINGATSCNRRFGENSAC